MKKETGNTKVLIFMIFLLGVGGIFPIGLLAQQSENFKPKNGPIKLPDAHLEWENSIPEKDSAFFYKLIHPFQKSRNKKEQERIVALIEKHLKVDKALAEEISRELIRLTDNQAYFQNYNKDNEGDKTLLEAKIQDILRKLDRTAEINEVEDIARELAIIHQGMKDDLEKEQIAIRNEIRKKINVINRHDFNYDSTKFFKKVSKVNDSIFLSLDPKMRVFAWHDGNQDPKTLEKYNFNFLTDIIYYGYELAPDGNNGNEKLLNNLLKDNTLSTMVSKHRVKLSLSVYSKSTANLNAFLNNVAAQETLISNFKEMQAKIHIEGINIYFENLPVQQKRKFSDFIGRLRKSLQSQNEKLLVTVSLPSISNQKEPENAEAFDLVALKPLTDYFLIQTDKVKLLDDLFTGSPSPLFKLEEGQSQSIESTLDYYANRQIPAKQIVMTVSYLGLNWTDIDNISLHPANRVSELGFIKIRDYFKDSDRNFYYGYDAVQESPYYTYYENGRNQQLWFEDGNSLYKKYNYALDRYLGGVAIWALATDSKNTDLWNALGASLVEIDTINLEKKITPESSLFDYVTLYFSDLMWAMPNDITIGKDAYSFKRQKELDRDRYCMWDLFKNNYQLYKNYKDNSTKITDSDLEILRPDVKPIKYQEILESTDSIKNLIIQRNDSINYIIKLIEEDYFSFENEKFVKINSGNIWMYIPFLRKIIPLFKGEPKTNEDIKKLLFLDNPDQCTCLAFRWERYSYYHKIAGIVSLIISFLVFWFVFHKTLRSPNGEFTRKKLYLWIAWVFAVTSMLMFLAQLYFSIYFTKFGATSDEVNIFELALILFIGLFIGWFSGKFKMK